jgi:hypothetical protein
VRSGASPFSIEKVLSAARVAQHPPSGAYLQQPRIGLPRWHLNQGIWILMGQLTRSGRLDSKADCGIGNYCQWLQAEFHPPEALCWPFWPSLTMGCLLLPCSPLAVRPQEFP